MSAYRENAEMPDYTEPPPTLREKARVLLALAIVSPVMLVRMALPWLAANALVTGCLVGPLLDAGRPRHIALTIIIGLNAVAVFVWGARRAYRWAVGVLNESNAGGNDG